MKIYARVMSGTGLVLIAFLVAFAALLYQSTTVLSLKNYEIEVAHAVQEWDEVQLSGQNMLLLPQHIDTLETAWNGSIVKFDEHLAALQNDARLAILGSELAGQIKTAADTWTATRYQLETARRTWGEFKRLVVSRYDLLQHGGQNGLQAAAYELSKNGVLSEQDLFHFNTFNNALKNVFLANRRLTESLERLQAGIIERAARLGLFLTLLTIAVAALLCTAALIWLHAFAVKLSRRTRGIEANMKRVADKDFSSVLTVAGNDEIAFLSRHLSEVVESLGTFLRQVRLAVSNVSEIKDELANAASDNSEAANKIAGHISTIKDQFIDLDKDIEQANAILQDTSAVLASFSEEAQQQSSHMHEAGTQFDTAIEQISGLSQALGSQAEEAETLKRVVLDGGEKVSATNDIIKTVSRDIDGILEVIELIDQISEQTNILSMNAAIESAHAGAAGKGFAVVAEEIRKLAESTQDNAQRIAEALSGITEKISSALSSSEASSKSFDDINNSILEFVSEMGRLADTARESSSNSGALLHVMRDTVESSKRISEQTSSMYEHQKTIEETMTSIRQISAGTLAGMKDIDSISCEILDHVNKMEDLSARSGERVSELRESMSGFRLEDSENRIRPTASATIRPLVSDSTAVAVKKPPKRFWGLSKSRKTKAELHAGDLNAQVRLKQKDRD